MNKWYRSFYKFLKTINLPIIPVWIGVLFVLNYVISKPFEFFSASGNGIIEIKEAYFAFLFMLAALYLLQNSQSREVVGVSHKLVDGGVS